MAITIDQIKELKAISNVGINDCKAALEEANGDINKALEILRAKGIAKLAKRADKVASAGTIGTYLHNGQLLGVAVVNCETDFVGKNEDFTTFAKEIAMQVCSQSPIYIQREDIPADTLEKETEIINQELKESGKPANIIESMMKGKLEKFFEQVCLMDQPWIKDDSKKIKDLYNELAAKTGEKIVVKEIYRITI